MEKLVGTLLENLIENTLIINCNAKLRNKNIKKINHFN